MYIASVFLYPDLKGPPSQTGSTTSETTSSTSGGGGLALQSRSPFHSSMTQSNMQQRSVNSVQMQSLPVHLNTADLYSSSPVAQSRLPQHAHLSKSDGGKLSSRGVLSLQPGSHDSSNRSANSSLSYSEYGSYDGAPVDPHTSGMYGASLGHPVISGVNSRPQGSGYMGAGHVPSHASPINGSGLQGHGYYYPQQSQHQQTHYGSVPSIPTYSSGGGSNWRHNERVPPPGVSYQPQHMRVVPQQMYPQRNYGPQEITPHANSHVPFQGQYFSHPHAGGQSAAMGSAAGNYHRQQRQPHTTNPYYQPHGPTPTYQHHHPPSSFYSSSFESSDYNVPNYSYEYGGHTHTNVPKVPLPSHASTSGHSSSAQSSYNAPQGGYAPNSIPYRTLSSYTSASSSSQPPSNAPQNGYICEAHPPSVHALVEPQSPEARGQPVHGQHLHGQPQPGYASHTSLSGSKPSASFEAKSEYRHPVSDASGDDNTKSQFCNKEEELVGSLEKLKLKSHFDGELPSPSKHSVPAKMKLGFSQLPSSQQTHTDDDNESVCTSLLSGPLSRVEEFDDKTHFLADPSIEILEHPQNCEVARNSRVELTCKAHLINSKLEEELIYLWYKDGEPLVGEISSECVLEEVGEGEVGSYLCVVSHPNGHCSEQTRAAQVTIKTGKGELRTHGRCSYKSCTV